MNFVTTTLFSAYVFAYHLHDLASVYGIYLVGFLYHVVIWLNICSPPGRFSNYYIVLTW